MKTLVRAAVALIAFVAGDGAAAADLPVKALRKAPPPRSMTGPAST